MSKSRPMSLTVRVLLFVALAIAVCLLTVGLIIESSIEHHFAEQDAEELQVVADSVLSVLHDANNDPVTLPTALASAIAGHHGVYFQVSDENNQLIFATPGANLGAGLRVMEQELASGAAPLQTWMDNNTTYRGTALKTSINTHTYTIITAADMDFHLHFLESFQLTLWSILIAAASLTLIAAGCGVHFGLAPLRKLSQNIRAIQSDRLHLRLDPANTALELQTLVESFNHMLGRLEDGFKRLTNFSADLAHELRTPLTNLITQTQVGLGKARQPEEYRELLYSSLEELERLSKMSSDMLWLAQTDHGLVKPDFSPVNVQEEIQLLFEFFGPWADENQVTLSMTGSAPPARGDKGMLRRAFSNLLSNAIRHTAAAENVHVTLQADVTGAIKLTISNPGTDIETQHLPLIFDRFYRADESRQRQHEGGGLGLAIVKSIIEIHGGSITVQSEQGLTSFIVTLPATTTNSSNN